MKILVEGGGYPNAWIETQPMGGEMYAKRDVQMALNNQVIFMLGQRADGRMPGMVVSGDTARQRGWDKKPPEGYVWLPEHDMAADYEMFQGYCFPEPAWRMYFWVGKDKDYLRRLYAALEAHDAYLWRTRDSNGDGLLETWCVWDTGEDHSTRLTTRGAPNRWPFDSRRAPRGLPDPQRSQALPRYWVYQHRDKLPPPTREEVLVPFASMDIMAYSYAGRATLAKIARELGNGKEAHWRRAGREVRSQAADRATLGSGAPRLLRSRPQGPPPARTGPQQSPLHVVRDLHPGNGRRIHQASPAESRRILDAGAAGVDRDQRAALSERGGEQLERPASGADLSARHRRAGKLRPLRRGHPDRRETASGPDPQRMHVPPTTRPHHRRTVRPKPDGYGPMILAALEYISRMHGIHLDVEHDRVWWSGLGTDGKDFTYTQRWGDKTIHAFRQRRAADG